MKGITMFIKTGDAQPITTIIEAENASDVLEIKKALEAAKKEVATKASQEYISKGKKELL